MKQLSRALGFLLVTSSAVVSLSISITPVALADTMVGGAKLVAIPSDGDPPCDLAHVGSDWRWHDNPRGGHWDHWERNRDDDRWEWKHFWRDDQRCNGDNEQGSGSNPQGNS